MAAIERLTQPQKISIRAEVSLSLGLFLLALLPRAYDLHRFVTADEAKWVYRSAQFLAAFLRADFAATSVNLTPAVTTTWLGSLGLSIYYWLKQASLNLSFNSWLLAQPEFRVEMPVLVAVRWPMVIFTALGVVLIYRLARRLFSPTVAFVAAAFIALDPHTVSLSRIIGHDAPVAIFMTISLLLLLLAVRETAPRRPPVWQTVALSGLAAGLAILSKAPALFLIPFAGLLFLGQIWRKQERLPVWLGQGLLWLAVAYLTVVIFWPAAWVEPVGRPLAVAENAFLSATDQAEADSENHWLVPELGPFYYIVNGGFKLSPLVLVGAGLALIPLIRHRPSPQSRSPDDAHLPTSPPSNLPTLLLWLFLFVLLFTLFMTFGDKRSPRYILPVFSPLAFLAAVGWLALYRSVGQASAPNVSLLRLAYPLILLVAAIAILLPHAPYYFTYYNPLLGGGYTAPRWVKIGWGEGLDQVGRFLQRELGVVRVGTAYASTVAPFFQGDLSGVTGDRLDYVVLYSKQRQSGEPSPAIIRYYQQLDPIFTVNLNGLHYADVYPGPAVRRPLAGTSPPDAARPHPAGFRLLTPYGQIGETLELDLIWPAGAPLTDSPATVTLTTLDGIAQAEGETAEAVRTGSQLHPVLAQGTSQPAPIADELVVSRHRLPLPEDLERGNYGLLVDGRPLGKIELRHFQPPPNITPVRDTVFDNQIALIGYQFGPTEDYISVRLVWQAQKSWLPNYTVFVQLLDAETNQRVAGIDSQPVKGEWPTSRWVADEVVSDRHLVAVPPNLPPGYYKIITGLYRPETGERLLLNNNQDHWLLPWTFVWKRRDIEN